MEDQNDKSEYEQLQEVYKFIPKGRHTWRQQGFYLVCKSCELQHAIYIGPQKIMVGEDQEGRPILKNRI